MKTFLDRFRRKGKDDESPEGVADLFAGAGTPSAESKSGTGDPANGPGTPNQSGSELRPATAPDAQSSDNHVRLDLGDFLHRIPQNLLRPGPHDVSAPLLFNINDLSKLIATGQTSINLAEIYRRTPDIFRAEVHPEDNVEVRFPWQKLMHLVKSTSDDPKGTSGITPVAAEALAQKIRSRRPSRGAPTAEDSGAAVKPPTPPTPAYREPGQEKPVLSEVPKAPESQQLSWFTQGGSDKGPVPLPGGKTPPPRQIAPPVSPAASAEGRTNFNRDDLVRARDAAMLQLSETKAEFDRRAEAFTVEREAMVEERDRAVAQLEAAKAELAAKTKQIEENERVGAKRGTEIAETIAQRDALQQEVTAKDAQLASLTEEISALKNRGAEASSTTSATLKERDALVADLANVRRELAEKNDQIELHKSLGAKSAEEAAKLASEREALQAQVAEQASALDTIKAELRGLREGGGKKYAAIAEERDKVAADLKQARKELAEKIEQIELQQSLGGRSAEDANRLSAERAKLQKELEAKTAGLETLKAQLEALEKSGAEKLAAVAEERDRIASNLERAKQELAEKSGQIELQQTLSVNSAEDASRLIAERESLKKELAAKTSGLDAIKAQLEALEKTSGAKIEVIAGERDRIAADLERAKKELAEKNGKIELQQNLSGKTAEETGRLNAEREKLEKELAAKNAALDTIKAQLAAIEKSSGEKLAAITTERDKIAADLEHAKKELTEKDGTIERQQGLSSKSAEEVRQLNAEREALQKELAAKTKGLDSFKSQLEAIEKGSGEKFAALTEERSKIAADLDRARQELADKKEQVEFQQSLSLKAAEDAARLIAERETLKGDVAARVGELATIRQELQDLKKGGGKKYAAIAEERDKVAADLKQARKELAEKIEQIELQQSLGGKSAEEATRLGAERDALQKELAAKNAGFDAIKAQLEALEKSSGEKLAAVTEERGKIATDLDDVRKELAAKIEQIKFQQSLSDKAAEDAARLVAERETLKGDVAAKAAELETIRRELQDLRKGGGKKYAAIAEERDKVAADLKQARKELAEKIEQVELQQSLGGKSADDAGRLASERDALQKELAAKTAALDAIKVRLEALEKSGGEKLAAITTERDRITADLDLARKELAKKIEQIELQENLGGKSANEVARLSAERDALQKELAAKTTGLVTLKAQLEATEKTGGEKLAAITEERGKIAADLDRARKELAEKIGEIEAQKKLAEKSAAEVADANSKREAIQKELGEKSKQLELLATELDSRKKEGGEKINSIVQERDSLEQLKTKLTEQLAQATASLAEKQKAVVEVGLSKKESQRQIDELQRRIVAFESGQRATSQELNRERETRIKTERSLAAAERARQEASAMIESMRTESKREVDAAARKREAEFTRAQKELQDRIDALTEANRKATAERDERIQEIEKVRAEAAASIEAIKAEVSAEAASGARWESRAVAGLEEDIAKYRERIKALLGERDAAAAAAKSQIEELQRARDTAAQEMETAAATHAKATAAQKSAIEELTSKAAAIEKEKTAISGELEQMRKALAERGTQLAAAQAGAEKSGALAAELRGQVEKLTGERDRLQADWDKLFAELEAVKEEAKKQSERFAVERAELQKTGDSALNDARREITALRASVDAAAAERAGLQKKLEAAAADVERVTSEHQREFAKLTTEHSSLLASHTSASTQAAKNLEAQEKLVANLRAEITDLKAGLHTTTGERADLNRQIAEAGARLDRAKADYEKQISELRSAHDAQLEKHLTTTADLTKTIAAHATSVADLSREIEESKSAIGDLTKERAQLQKKIEAAKAEAKKAKTDFEKQLAAVRAEEAALRAAQQAAAGEFAAAIKAHEGTVATLKEEIQRHISLASGDIEKAKATHREELAAARAEQDELRSKHQAATDGFAKATREHEAAVAALNKELSKTKKESADQLERARLAQEKLRLEFEAEERAFNETKKELQNRIADAERAAAEIAERAQSLDTIVRNRESALAERDAAIARLKEEHKSALATLSKEHAAGLDSLTAEKDRQLAAITLERAKVVASLSRERDDLAAKLAAMEESLTGEIASLSSARDEAVRESATLAQRLAALAVESDRKLRDLKSDHDAVVSERQTLVSQLESAREEHKAQSGVFAREFKGIVKQRDEASGALETARAELAEKTAALAREKANLEKVEAEAAARLEREVTRMRRERDVLLRQRDELHGRIAKTVEEQRQLLEELNVQSTRQTPLPTDVAPPARSERQTNVIEITAAQIVQHNEPEQSINLPRVRPVPIPPPNVRIL